VSVIQRLLEPFTELVRWGEPHDVEDDDPFLDSPWGGDEPVNLWA
jgi:hypothetical protein